MQMLDVMFDVMFRVVQDVCMCAHEGYAENAAPSSRGGKRGSGKRGS